MKKIVYIYILVAVSFSACADFLEEHPQNFEDATETLTTTKGFQAFLNGLHSYLRQEFQTWSASQVIVSQTATPYEVLIGGTDVAAISTRDNTLPIFETYTFNASTALISNRWRWAYGLIANANMMYDAADNESVSWNTPADKNHFKANAAFFRAYAYRYLVYLYGDVPLVLHIQAQYRTDFERTAKSEVIDQMVNDLEFAAKYLPEDPSKVQDGQLTKWAALHLLSDVSLLAGNNERAKTAALEVINSGHYQLMKNRFGVQKDRTGDVFSDLFKDKNFNRGGGNLESIWVIQAEYQTNGGGDRYTDWTRRAFVPGYYNVNGFMISVDYGGRGLGQLIPTDWWLNLYENGDIRNSEYNIRRIWKYNNPNVPELYGKIYGQANEKPAEQMADFLKSNRKAGNIFPTTTKFEFGIENDPTYEGNDKEKYRMRLAETYLLLAEACIKLGESENAAVAINAVRERANASPADKSKVDIDYLLDERARELFGEEFRRFTLVRTGKLIERTKKYNPESANHIKDHNALWPIPQTVIDSNTGNKWKNNPDY
jgi:hypothetical protein